MRKPILATGILFLLLSFSLTGCESIIRQNEIPEEDTGIESSVVVEPTATPVPATATPMPTPTPAPRMMGDKTAEARSFYLINNIGEAIRGLYIRDENYDTWGNNLIPAESSFRAGEEIQLYYIPVVNGTSRYEIRIDAKNGQSYYLYGVPLEDVDPVAVASFIVNNSTNEMNLRYTSASSGEVCDTAGSWMGNQNQNGNGFNIYDEEYQEYTTEETSNSGYQESYYDSNEGSSDSYDTDTSYDSSYDTEYDYNEEYQEY